MTNRVTDAEVKEIISLRSLTDTTPFIDMANSVVTEQLGTSGLSTDRLTIIEKYLAAHLVALHPDERQLTKQKIGDSEDTYGGSFGQGLKFTYFGQQALDFDTTGTLKGMGGEIAVIEHVEVDYE